MRRTHTTEPTPRAMDAMRPWQAFGLPSAPAALDPRRWLAVVLAVLERATARIARPGAWTWGRSGDGA
jgi:hypothetical protein